MARPPSTLSSPSLALFVAGLERRGVDLSKVKARFGVGSGPPRVPIDRVDAFISACTEQSGDPLDHVKIALGLPRGAWGAVEFLWRSAPTLEHAYQAFRRSAPLISEVLAVDLKPHAGGFRLLLHTGLGRHSDEFTVVSTLTTVRQLLGDQEAGLGLGFSHPKHEHAPELARLARVPISFDEADNWISLTDEAFRRTSETADPALFAAIDQLLGLVSQKLTRPRDFLSEVEAAIAAHLAEAQLDLPAIARALRLTPRTLQRRLDEEATSFSHLLTRVRRRAAEDLLADLKLPLDEVAFKLGFSEFSAFARAYKRWTGLAPGAARATYVRRERNSGPRRRVQPV